MGRSPRAVAAALIALVVLASACTTDAARPSSTITTATSPQIVVSSDCDGGSGVDALLVPECGVLLGTIDAPGGAVPLGIDHQQATVASSQPQAVEADEGFQFELVRVYQRGSGAAAALNESVADLAAEGERLLYFSWKVDVGEGAWARVASGVHDRELEAFAAALAATDQTIFLSIHHEPESDGEGSAAEYVAMWRHAHDVIESALSVADGRGRAVWVMNYTGHVDGQNLDEVAEFYPGEAYVDWMSYNPYNWAVCRGNADWRSFLDVATPMYTHLTTDARFFDASGEPKPILIGETATNEDPVDPNRKAEWLSDMASVLEQGRLPHIKAVIYFNQAAPDFCDRYWDSSEASASAFSELATRGFFNPLTAVPGSG